MKVFSYSCPIWLFGPLLFLSTPKAAIDSSRGSTSPLDILSGFSASVERVVLDTVSRDETLSDIFLQNGLSYAELMEVLDASKDIFNLNRLRYGSVVKLVYDGGEKFRRLEYEIDDRKLLLVESYYPDSVTAHIDEVAYQYRQRLLGGEITSSLYQTVHELNEDMAIAYLLSEIFAWQIDFSTDIRGGDHFRAIVEEYWGRDGVPKLNTVLAAEFYNNGRLYQAFRFSDKEGHVDYYDGTGSSLRRKFLKSPLKYTRISSRFSRRRLHPILKVYRPHLGVDYAAPTGTPVVTVGEGEVIFVGWQEGFGKIVKVRHSDIYQTTYGHLKGFARGIRRGVKVKQGQVIGYVGATGLATGPHLDFRLTRRGSYVNPLTVDLPTADPVKKAYQAEFRRTMIEYARILDSEKPSVLALQAGRGSP